MNQVTSVNILAMFVNGMKRIEQRKGERNVEGDLVWFIYFSVTSAELRYCQPLFHETQPSQVLRVEPTTKIC